MGELWHWTGCIKDLATASMHLAGIARVISNSTSINVLIWFKSLVINCKALFTWLSNLEMQAKSRQKEQHIIEYHSSQWHLKSCNSAAIVMQKNPVAKCAFKNCTELVAQKGAGASFWWQTHIELSIVVNGLAYVQYTVRHVNWTFRIARWSAPFLQCNIWASPKTALGFGWEGHH